MIYYFTKILISSILILIISEISKRNSIIGAIFASIPLISILSFIWIYQETKNIETIIILSKDIFFLVIPSLIFFIVFPIFLRMKISFYSSMFLSIFIMIIFYRIMIFIMEKIGIR